MNTTLLPEINRKKTKCKVETELNKYRIFLLTQSLDKLPKVTASYSLVSPTNNGGVSDFHSSTEETAISNVDYLSERQYHLKKVMTAVNRLGYMERAIIIRKYMQDDDVFDYEIYSDLGMSERKYYRIKGRALYKLAFALRCEVYEECVVQ